jgi:DNA-binding CsgD family transcriptional regulator
MEVRQRLEADEGVAEDFRASLEELRKPALLVDAECRIQFANSVAGRLLSAGELRATAGGSIVTRRAEQTRMVHRLVSEVLVNASSGGRLVVQRSNARPLTLLISPLHRSASPFARRSALILIDDPEQDERGDAPATLLHALYRLTKSEAQLAVLVAGGNRLRQAAEQRGICLATARTHLAHIFQKTGVASQGELIRLLIASGIVSSVGPFG